MKTPIRLLLVSLAAVFDVPAADRGAAGSGAEVQINLCDELMEISRKVGERDALTARAEIQDRLAQAGLQVCADQSSQARAKLEDLLPRR